MTTSQPRLEPRDGSARAGERTGLAESDASARMYFATVDVARSIDCERVCELLVDVIVACESMWAAEQFTRTAALR
jgi:hypothetical protein